MAVIGYIVSRRYWPASHRGGCIDLLRTKQWQGEHGEPARGGRDLTSFMADGRGASVRS